MLEFVSLSADEFLTFAKEHPMNSIYQTPSWAGVKSNWTPVYYGVKENDQLLSACLFLLRPIPLGFNFAYAPRGPLLDFNNKEITTFFFTNCRKVLRKRRVLLGKFDPLIFAGQLPLEDKEHVPLQKSDALVQQLQKLHCRHSGYTLSLKQTIQPRIQLAFPVTEEIDDRIPTKTRKKIRSSAKKDVVIKKEFDTHSLAQMIEYTQKRHNISLRNPSYFDSILKNFKDDACTLSAYQGETLISSCLLVRSKNTAEILYSGYHDDYRKTDSTYLLRYHAIQWAKENGCASFNFGGVEGTLDDGLFMFKSSFNPQLDIYIGEFDLLTYPLMSSIVSRLFPFLKSKISI